MDKPRNQMVGERCDEYDRYLVSFFKTEREIEMYQVNFYIDGISVWSKSHGWEHIGEVDKEIGYMMLCDRVKIAIDSGYHTQEDLWLERYPNGA